MKELIVGGVRTGKSRHAEERARESGLEVTYIATARDAVDPELRDRIRRHRERRCAAWTVIEEPIRLGATLAAHAAGTRLVLVDCLTLWLTNLLWAGEEALVERELRDLERVFPELPGRIILVSNEVGFGVVPVDAMTRRFIDEIGVLHQWLARACERVVIMFAGIPLVLKDAAP
jgi:adenosylcobinamide kinase / adenosylcobinamide-phosphate guanylyltransferase